MNKKIKWLVILMSTALLLLAIRIILANKTKTSSQYENFEIVEMEKDSIINMSFDMEEIIESIFTNQGYKLPKNIYLRKVSDKNIISNFEEDIIYAYISPLSCWSCVRSIKKHLTSVDNIIFLIPIKYSNNIQTFLDYIEIPSDKVFFLSKNLGLPIEKTDKVFLFTISDNNTITNVFPPTKYSHKITTAYVNSILKH